MNDTHKPIFFKIVQLPKVEMPEGIEEKREIDVYTIHTGYSWRKFDSCERVYEHNKDKSLLIDVLGEEELKRDTRGELYYQERVIATVTKEDAELYKALQIKEMFRNHSDVSLGKAMATLFCSIALTVIGFIVLMVTNPTLHILWQVPVMFFGSLVGIVILSFVKNRFVYSYRFLLLVYRVWLWKFKLSRTSSYYRNLLETLSLCNNKDKAGTAKTLRYFV